MATPMAAVIPRSPPASSSSSSAEAADSGAAGTAAEAPVLIFVYFHKAIRAELEKLHAAAVRLATEEGGGDVAELERRCRFLFSVYRHHCDAEDAVIFPALDIRVKNVAGTYSLEHKRENDLFAHLFALLRLDVHNNDGLRRELASCAGAIRTFITQHMFKEEEQVFPLLITKFSYEEQADLVWQFICNIPVNMMAEFLPWLSSSVSPDEHQDILNCLHKIVPQEKLLQQVVFAWIGGKAIRMVAQDLDNPCSKGSCGNEDISHQTDDSRCSHEHSKVGKRKYAESSHCQLAVHPIDEILWWHNAIRKELSDIVEETRKIQQSGDFSNISTFNARLRFIADVCIFHSIGEDQVIFPAVDGEVCFEQEHAEQEQQFNKFRCLIEQIQTTGARSTAVDFYSELCSQADQIMYEMEKHFNTEETKVLPQARIKFSPEKQSELLYKSLCVMPLKLLEQVLPWFASKLDDANGQSFLQNMFLIAPSSETALVTLLSGWACKGRLKDTSNSGKFICMPSGALNCSLDGDELEKCQSICPCSLGNNTTFSVPQTENSSRRVKRGNHAESSTNINISHCRETTDIEETRCSNKPCHIPGLRVETSSFAADSFASLNSFRSLSYSYSAPSLHSSLFSWETDKAFSSPDSISRPIDAIFKFHKAIRKDLEFLDVESGKLIDRDKSCLRQFIGRFRLLWGLYRAHSNAEDEIVFPALESKDALHNVSHSYTLDHKQEEELFQDISTILSELSQLFDDSGHPIDKAEESHICSYNELDSSRKHNELLTKLQGMCKSIRVTLSNHVHREELELWPLFDKHFSVDDQDKIVGRIIGSTGAEVLQSMIPWVTSALSLEEQNKMMDTWKQATKNTMFDEWLNEWWKSSPTSSGPSYETSPSEESQFEENLNQSDQKFKPGWKDIFRMNQSELEAEIRKVSQDSTLDPRRKAYLIQNLMTSRWIASQQESPQPRSVDHNGSTAIPGCSPSYRDPEKKILGCEHYKRNCKLMAACCNKLFTCRFCHDKVSDHTMERKATVEMMCMLCMKVQPVGPNCQTPSCNGLSMAKYYCSICKFFDDERSVYHCPFCNLCRLGEGLGTDFFHCMKCNCCLGVKLKEHKCREKMLEMNCPICCDFLFTSSAAVRGLPCGHFMHSACFQAYTCTHYTCPICCKSLGDMTVYFGMLDGLLAAEELPEEYRNRCQDILCNDCGRKGRSRFHWLYHKCGACGSYNTRVIKTDTPDCSTSNQQAS
uniref:Uncharacterized protein n=1 Tax=Avena sativa TaxID=4498 RepID=A0ACD5TE23_AVESA